MHSVAGLYEASSSAALCSPASLCRLSEVDETFREVMLRVLASAKHDKTATSLIEGLVLVKLHGAAGFYEASSSAALCSPASLCRLSEADETFREARPRVLACAKHDKTATSLIERLVLGQNAQCGWFV